MYEIYSTKCFWVHSVFIFIKRKKPGQDFGFNIVAKNIPKKLSTSSYVNLSFNVKHCQLALSIYHEIIHLRIERKGLADLFLLFHLPLSISQLYHEEYAFGFIPCLMSIGVSRSNTVRLEANRTNLGSFRYFKLEFFSNWTLRIGFKTSSSNKI